MHPRNLVVTWPYVHPAARPSARQAHQYKITQSTGMATQMQLKVYLEGHRMSARTFRERKKQQRRVFFDVIFDVYTHVDNSERARASD